jgi:lipopolysaccharide transport system ATP-binding protein
MYVRLAFAVAAHLESEILIVDEVLAVGDAEFQKKCLGRMKDVSAKEGRTVLFVSHNMAAVRQLCTSAVVMKNGRLVFEGTQTDGVNFYQTSHNTNSEYIHEGDIHEAPGNQHIRIKRFEVKPTNGEVISISSGFNFELEFLNYKEDINLDVTFELKNSDEIIVFHNGTVLSQNKDSKKGYYKVSSKMPPHTLNAGVYKFTLIFGENQRYEVCSLEDFIQFEIMNESSGSNNEVLPGLLHLNMPFNASLNEAH